MISKEKLKKLYNEEELTHQEIGEKLDVDCSTVSRWCSKYNINCSNKISIPKEKIENLYINNDMTQKEVANKLNVSDSTVSRLCREYNIDTSKYRNTLRKVDENYFEEIDSKNKSYWLGFITGDGCIHKEGVRIKLNKRDEHLLYDFKEDIESTHKITDLDYENCKQINITRQKIANDLKELGLPVNKSHKNISIPDVPEKYMNHYIRGLFDADGSIRERKEYNGGRFGITGTEKLIKEVKSELERIVKYKKETYSNKNSYVIAFYKESDLKKIHKYIYEDADRWLKRKRKKFEKVI